MNEFRRRLVGALVEAWDVLVSRVGEESLYGFSLFTSGEDDFGYVCVSANTEEGLTERASEYAKKNVEYLAESGRRRLRWSVPDWKYHHFDDRVSQLELPSGQGRARDGAIYRDFVFALKAVQHLAQDSALETEVTFLVACGDMSESWFLRGLKRLNPEGVVQQYIDEYTAQPYKNWLMSLPLKDRTSRLLSLYRELSLRVSSEQTADATARQVTEYDLKDLIVDLGPGIVSELLDLVEAFGFGELFNEKGSPAYARDGVVTCEMTLSTSAVFLIADIGSVTESEIRRMQAILERRVSCDQGLKMTYTLAENLARVLHQLRPNRFPASVLNPSTNHLENPEPFLVSDHRP